MTSGSQSRRSRSAAIASRQRSSSSRWSVLTTQKDSSTATVAPILATSMLVSVIDPAAYTPPYDRALCAALARAGAEVELVTARSAHDVLPREALPGQRAAQRRLLRRMDAIVVHSEHGRARLVDELAVDAARVHVIPHGVLRPEGEATLPAELTGYDGPVVLCFGLLRPYKGVDVLLEAWRGIAGAELWVVGAPRMDTAPLHAAPPPGVRFVERFVSEGEAAALMRRAELAVLPYREIDQSGVLFTALGFGVPLVLTAVGGFPEIAGAGAATLVPPGDPAALHDALAALLVDSD